MPASLCVRDAIAADLPAINAIYNHYVPRSTCTYQTEQETAEAREAWFRGRRPEHPVIVAEWDGTIIAWGSLSAFGKRAAWGITAENSVYVHADHHRQGLGRLLMEELIRRARHTGILHSIVAVISADQEGSVALHASLGFLHTGRLRDAGCKFGRILDVVYMQYLLRENEKPPA